MKKIALSVLLGIFLVLGASTAFAGETQKESNWDFSLAPLYLWAVNMDGEMGIGPVNTGLSVDFGTIFDNLETVFTFHFEGVHRSNWGFFLDYSYIDISASTTLLSLDFTSVLAEAGGYYRIGNGPHTFDFLGGVRYTKLESDITIGAPPPTFSLTEDWVDPIVGLRYAYTFNDKWQLNLRGDIGGFGAGSDFTWNAIGLIQFQPWKYAAILAGYRALDQDYESGSGLSRFKYDMRLAGPVIALNFVW
jgi:hypothetical protein